MSEEGEEEYYLGEGLYASYDGFTIKLRAPTLYGGDHEVYLEPEVYANFIVFSSKVYNRSTGEKPNVNDQLQAGEAAE